MNIKALLEMHDIILKRLTTERQRCREMKQGLGLTRGAMAKMLLLSFEECDRIMCENLTSTIVGRAGRYKICSGLLKLDREIQLLINGKNDVSSENAYDLACVVHENFTELVFEIVMLSMLQEYPQSLTYSPAFAFSGVR